jgi:hypothetical protein
VFKLNDGVNSVKNTTITSPHGLGILHETLLIKQTCRRTRHCEIYKSAEDKMAGSRKENGSRGDAKKDNGRTTVYRKKERKTPSEMDR